MAEDVRIIKNKRVIENAMILLLQRKEFSKITIQDICQEALVSRSTFYAHYLDKYDLLEKIVDKYFSMLQELIASRFSTVELINIDAIFLLLSQTYSQYKEILSVLMKVHVPGSDFREKIENTLFSYCIQFLEATSKQHKMPNKLMAKLYVANVITIIDWTLEQGIDEKIIESLSMLQSTFFHLIEKDEI